MPSRRAPPASGDDRVSIQTDPIAAPRGSPGDRAERALLSAQKASRGRLLRGLAPLFVLVGLCVLLAIANPNFIEPRNLVRIANSAAVPLTLAMGTTFVILLGSIDLSVEGAVAIAAMALVLLAGNDANGNDFGWLAALAAVGAAGLMGFGSGLVQTTLRIPSFMATLGTWFIGLGLAVFM